MAKKKKKVDGGNEILFILWAEKGGVTYLFLEKSRGDERAPPTPIRIWRGVPGVPPATPLLCAGTLPITMLLLGVWNNPAPRPVIANASSNKGTGVFWRKALKVRIAAAKIPRPIQLISRPSVLSEIAPLTGAVAIIIKDIGSMIKPEVEIGSICCC